jgi:predicted regulator of Ras-like GTPase activity (Roadblock/LC7/MglB family)
LKEKAVTVQADQSLETAPVVSVAEENSVFANLAATLSEVRKLKGVTGYMLRNNTSAIIDVTPKESLTDYAVLSSQIHESALATAKQFNLAEVESVLVEGSAAKVLCMSVGDNRLSIFMDKTCGHAWIVKRILL